MGHTTSKKRSRKQRLSTVNPNAAGIDIGSQFHVVAVPADRDEEAVRTFQSFTGDLHRLADWLVTCRIDTVAMESTGIYWIPLYEILEARGIAVVVANAREVKHVPGRKTDVNDAQWLQQLHAYGLLRGSFHPPADIAALRAYLRQRERLLDYAASHIQNMQKALMQMNLQLHHVVSDITGKTGMRIIRAILDGIRDPATLASYRDARCKASAETIAHALEGNYRPEHLFALSQAVALYDTYQRHVAECDQHLEALLVRLRAPEPPTEPPPAPRHTTRQPNALNFDVRAALYAMVGVDLTQIHGIGPSLALKLVSKCGTDLSKWPTAKHFTSWLCLAPAQYGMVCSMSRTGNCRDNAPTESWFNSFKNERVCGERFATRDAMKATAFEYIEVFYNRKRLHYTLGYTSPVQFLRDRINPRQGEKQVA